MANNFRLTGNYYVSKAGNNSNSGATPDLPKLTLAGVAAVGGNGNIVVVGAGTYKEAFNSIRTIKCDGFVKFLGDGTNDFKTAGGNSGLANAFLEGYLNIEFSNNCTLEFCTFYNNTAVITNAGGSITASDCIFINCTIYLVNGCNLIRCIFINCIFFYSGNGQNAMTNCYADAGTVVYGNMFIPGNTYQNLNNLQGGIKVNANGTGVTGVIQDISGGYYDLSLTGIGGDGSQANPFKRDNCNGKAFLLAAHKIAYPGSNPNSISAPPLFKNVSKQDFSISATSPNLALGVASSLSKLGSSVYSGSSELSVAGGAVIVNLSGTNDLVVSTGQASGYIISAPVFFASSVTEITLIKYLGSVYHNKSSTPPSIENRNVPDASVFGTSDSTGANNPDRLIFELRWSTQLGAPASDSEWDNQGYYTAGSYQKFTWFAKPLIDSNAKTNADPTFNIASTYPIGCTWYQIKVTLSNNYIN